MTNHTDADLLNVMLLARKAGEHIVELMRRGRTPVDAMAATQLYIASGDCQNDLDFDQWEAGQ